MQSSSLIAAVVTASVAVIVAIVTQIWTSRRERSDRRYAARRQAITDAQDAALDLRTTLGEYGESVRESFGPDVALNRALQRARGRFEITTSRVQDPVLVGALEQWERAASARFLSVQEVDASVEDDWFHYVNDLAGAALRSTSGQSTPGLRSRLTPPR